MLCPGMIDTNIVDPTATGRTDLVTELTEDQKFVTDYLDQAVAGGMDPGPGGPNGDRGHPKQ